MKYTVTILGGWKLYYHHFGGCAHHAVLYDTATADPTGNETQLDFAWAASFPGLPGSRY